MSDWSGDTILGLRPTHGPFCICRDAELRGLCGPSYLLSY